MEEKQKSGCKVIVVTYKPDCYNFGDAQYWMQLQEQMRRNGFIMNLVEEYCERYCIIDRKIVWYGSLNFLGKSDIDDNLMRISNSDIATELIELTFNNQNQKGESLGI